MSMRLITKVFLFLSIIFLTNQPVFSQPPQHIIDYIISEVNQVRQKGVRCGSERMPAVGKIKWDNTLYRTARSHAMEMDEHNYFGHISIEGLDVADRMDSFGYKWRNAGENLGEGQKYFDQVLKDWIKSPSHCKTLMHPKMEDMAVSKYGKYWVQHFGRRMPPGHKRINKKYSEH